MKTAILQMALTTLSIAAVLTVGWPARSDAEGLRRRADADGVRHLSAENTIGDLLRHPAFAGFAGLLLPWDNRPYDEQTKQSAIGALLPYHSHVDAASAASAL
jgi:hypothetical protein